MLDNTPKNISDSLYKRLWNKEKTLLPIDFIEDIIEWLENIRSRPRMFFIEESPNGVSAFSWFVRAVDMLGFDTDPECDIYQERGWRLNSFGYTPSMKEKGLTDKEMAQEMLTIEILTWKKLLEKSKLALAQQNNESHNDPATISKNE
jgi:hypothetical protein